MPALIDPGFLDHPKWEQLTDAAFRLGIRALAWARKPERRRLPGFIPSTQLVYLSRRTPAIAARLAEELMNAGTPAHEVGLWEPVDGGWLIHDFAEYDPIAAVQDAAPMPSKPGTSKVEAGRIGGARSAEARRERWGSAQPRGEDVVSGPGDGHDSASKQTVEADPEATPKQGGCASADGLGFPPDPLSEINNGSGLEDADQSESGSGIKLATTFLVSPGAREVGIVLPPGRTRKKAARAATWRRVPSDWIIKPDHRSLAEALAVDVEFEAAAFRDHEFQRPRSDADATFRNWLREASKRPRARVAQSRTRNAGTELLDDYRRRFGGDGK
jgi:hypothetical protein